MCQTQQKKIKRNTSVLTAQKKKTSVRFVSGVGSDTAGHNMTWYCMLVISQVQYYTNSYTKQNKTKQNKTKQQK